MSRSLVIILHGVGARGSDVAPLGDALRNRLPKTDFVAPDAPFPFDQGGPMRQWFSITGVTPANRVERVVAAREAFDRTVHAILADHGLADRPDRVAFVGFSQGSIMALDAVASGRWPVAATVAFAGRLASPPPFLPSGAKVLLVHGDADTVIPAAESEQASRLLQQAGADCVLRILPQVGHFITPEGVAMAGDFLAAHLGSAGPAPSA